MTKLKAKNIYPLSPMQEGMLFHSLLNKDSGAYFQQMELTMEGKVDPELLEKSFQKLIDRYDVLRTIFVHEMFDQPKQIVLQERKGIVVYQDISHLSENRLRDYIDNFKRRDREKGFTLAKDLLTRLAVLKVGEEKYQVIWSFHHILMDGWCTGILIREFFIIYLGLMKNEPMRLGNVYPYSNYIKWLKKQNQDQAVEYWKSYLKNYETLVSVPTIYGQRRDELVQFSFFLSESLTRSIRELIQQHQVTMNTFCQTVWGILLQKYNRTDDILFGSVVSGRPHELEGAEETLGLFINTIPVRIQSRQDEPVLDLLKRIQQDGLNSTRYDYYPLAKIQSQSEMKQNIFDHIIDFVNYPLDQVVLDSNNQGELPFQITGMEMFEQTNYDLNIVFAESNQLKVILKYNPTVYDQELMERIEDHFANIAKMMIENEKITLNEIQILSQREKTQIYTEFNGTDVDYPENQTIDQLFAVRAAENPNAVAVQCQGEILTYQELKAKAEGLARKLRRKGVGPDQIIGLMAERSLDLIISMIGILKAGAAYMPINPTLPTKRVKFMLEDSGAKILLTQSELLEDLEWDGEIWNLKNENFYVDKKDESQSLVMDQNRSDQLAYVIYTSGSTGQPKGVMVEHQALVNFLYAINNKFIEKVSNGDNCLSITNISFDVSVCEIFLPLIFGAKLVLLEEEKIFDIQSLARILIDESIHFAYLPPTLLTEISHLLKERLSNENVASEKSGGLKLNKMLVGVEPIKDCVLEDYLQLIPELEIINGYGPTEATICATMYRYRSHKPIGRNLPIGKPLENTKIYLLDQNDHPVPIGVAGELCISGDGLSRGYLNRKQLTMEKFTQHPEISGLRIYRTGDLARWLPDGNIEFIGRVDQQVKVRGYRIETGEIEAHLVKHELIKEAVVIAKENEQGYRYLIAYLISNHLVSSNQMRDFLLLSLPEYMIPTYFVQLEQIPLTENGKIHRQALPEPEGQMLREEEYIAPSNEKEEKMAKIWSEVLGVKKVGIYDNFFDLGGDSIKAIQMMSRLQKDQLTLEIKDLFDNPTIVQAVHYLREGALCRDNKPVHGELFLTPIQAWYFDQHATGIHHFNQAMMLYSKKGFSEDRVRQIFTKLIEHHDALRMQFPHRSDQILQYNRGLDEKLFDLHLIDLCGCKRNQTEEVKEKIILEEVNRLQQEIDLEKGPLVKLGLFKTDQGDHLLISIHHLVIDGVSWRILFEDLALGIQLAEEGKEIQFQPKTDSYQKWAKKLREYAEDRKLLSQLDYWKKVSIGELSSLPRDFENTENKWGMSQTYSVSFDQYVSQALLKNANQAYHTRINDLLLTALVGMIQGWTGEKRVALSLEGHGREKIDNDLDITRTIGWFTSLYPVLFDLTTAEDLSDEIKIVKESLRQIPDQGIGYGILKYLTPEEKKRGLKINFQPEVSFNYIGQFDQDLQNHSDKFLISELSTGESVSPDLERQFLLDVSCLIRNGQLIVSFKYNQNQYRPETIQQISDLYQNKLLQIIQHCSEKSNPELTPSDYGDSSLNFKELTMIQTDLKEMGEPEKIYPLSPMQEGMLFHSLYNSKSHAYFEQLTISARGMIDLALLKESFQILFQRYDVFRTVFIHENVTRPRQIVLNDQMPEDIFQLRDLSHLSELEQNKAVTEILEKDRSHGFDLEKEFPVRVLIIKKDQENYQIVWDYHHISMDGWCLSIVIGELVHIYTALSQNQLIQLRKPTPYMNYIQWLMDQDLAEARDYWSNYTLGYEEQARIPKTSLQRMDQEFQQEHFQFSLTESLTGRLRNLAERSQVTMNTVSQVIWGILLQKYNYTDDVIFGTIVSGRPPEIVGVEEMVGLFINTVPVRVKTTKEMTCLQLLKEAQRTSLNSTKYNYYPLAEIQAETEVKQNLIDHIMVFENYPIQKEIGNLGEQKELLFEISDINVFEQTNYDFNIVLIPGNELSVIFKYNSQVYSPEFVERISKHFITIAEQMVEDIKIPVRDIEILTTDEREEIISDFNDTQSQYPVDLTIQQLFQRQVVNHPEQVAAYFKDHEMSYSTLNRKANQLARLLRQKGICRDQVVALVTDRSLEMIIGIMAILKAGGAYLPIHPNYPVERIDFILKDSRTKLLLTQSHLIDISEFSGEKIDLNNPKVYQGNTENLENQSQPTDLAYLIYTSGSTGVPKGVMIEHRSLINFLYSISNRFDRGIGPDDRCLSLTNISFDVSVCEIFLPLAFGSTLDLMEDQQIFDLNELVWYLENRGITFAYLPPILLKELYQQINGLKLALNKILVGVEPIKVDLLADYIKLNPEMQIINGYGPTEATICATMYRYQMTNSNSGNVPIGKPVDNTRIYILNQHNVPVPIGIPGELWIAGDGLARGYLNRPEEMEKRFVINPFNHEQLYRTGDLARWLPDGNIEFLGRVDHQVKIRGYRIEPGEVKNQLLQFPGINDAVVIDRTDGSGEKYLCAYIISTHSDLEILKMVQEIREFLLQTLPEYMIPSQFVKLEKIPVTMNGKVNRKKLPEPKRFIGSGQEYVAATGETEERLVQIWLEILDLERVGIEDHFFMIGGHSLKATRLAARIVEEFQVQIPLRELFKLTTIQSQARFINSTEHIKGTDVKNPILLKAGMEKDQNLFFIHDGSGEVEGYLKFSDQSKLDCNYWGIRFDFPLNVKKNNPDLKEIASFYTKKIKEVQPIGPYYIAGWSTGGTIAFEIVNQLEKAGEEIGSLAMFDTMEPQEDILKVHQLVSKSVASVEEYLMGDEVKLNKLKRKIIPKGLARIIPHYDQLRVDEILEYLKKMQVISAAWASYVPDNQLKAEVHFFAAKKSKGVKKKGWEQFCQNPIVYHTVKGDHFDLFEMPGVRDLAESFDEVFFNLS